MVIETIRKCFAFLFDEYHFRVASENYFDSFGNWLVILVSDDYRIRFLQDRGYVDVAIGPHSQQPDWKIGPWFNLDLVLSFVSGGQDNLDRVKKEFGNLRQQLDELSKVYQPYSKSIQATFQESAFQGNEEKLRLIEKQWTERQWEKLKSSSNGT